MKNKALFAYIRIFSSLALCALFFSCSSSVQEADSNEEKTTLRYTADSLYEATIWTEEIEVDRLATKVNSVEGISSKLNLTPLIVLASLPSETSRIYPTLGSFGSLDTTLIPKALKTMLSSFSDNISKYKDADSFMAKDSLYSLALFYTDFKRIFNDCLELDKIDNPEVPEEKSDSKNPEVSEKADSKEKTEKSESPDEGADKTENQEEKAPLPDKLYFSSYKIGQPFLDGVHYQVPLKFFGEKASLTLCAFCFEESGSWKIDQIQIADWEIF